MNLYQRSPRIAIALIGWLVAVHIALVCAASPARAAAEKVALVIGVSEYKYVPRLRNPGADADLVSSALESIGFEVLRGSDVTGREFDDLLGDFARTARTARIALVYYAGHGIQVGQDVYLMPSDANIETERDLRYLIDGDHILQDAALASDLAVVILDACRNNPFSRRLAEELGTVRSASITRGLGQIDTVPRNTLVAYATAAGEFAYDGEGANSPFAIALAENIVVPGRDIRLTFGAVRDKVLAMTELRQEPYIYGSLGGDQMVLAAASATTPSGETPATETTVPKPQPEKTLLPRDEVAAVDALVAVPGDYAAWQSALARSNPIMPGAERASGDDHYYSFIMSDFYDFAVREQHPSMAAALEKFAEQRFSLFDFGENEIKLIQQKLAGASYYGGEIDGDFGRKTHIALESFAERYSRFGADQFGTLISLGEFADTRDVTSWLSGNWSGRYMYPRSVNGVTEVSFSMNLVLVQGRVSGSIAEPNTFGDSSSAHLYATFDGRIVGNQITWTKQYDGTAGVDHAVTYTGAIDRQAGTIDGTWSIGTNERNRGRFTVRLNRRKG